MKIDTYSAMDKFDYRGFYRIEINGESAMSVHDGEPEDANLGRDFSECYNVINMLKKAHAAGKAGEELAIEEHEVSLDDW